MIYTDQSVEIVSVTHNLLQHIENAGRVCYKSESRCNGTPACAELFVRGILKRRHEAVIEHGTITLKCITDRGVTHELVRHRLASYCQESTRYVKYDNLEVINPIHEDMLPALGICESTYKMLITKGVSPQIARDILPTCTKTEIVVTANIREWRHIIRLRKSKAAHPKMQTLATLIFNECMAIEPILFEDLQ